MFNAGTYDIINLAETESDVYSLNRTMCLYSS